MIYEKQYIEFEETFATKFGVHDCNERLSIASKFFTQNIFFGYRKSLMIFSVPNRNSLCKSCVETWLYDKLKCKIKLINKNIYQNKLYDTYH